ncbi:MAG: class I SAM-dependent methyltransferase [Acidobacteriia bacterium]|nr:class I SAM-dependent methyltransferase [Terriglobia bacterium]
MPPSYQDDLTYIHDVAFTDFIRAAIPGLLRILHHKRITGGLVIDLGCGSGIWARELTRAGYDVLGVDISDAMLKLARKRAPKARFVHSSLFQMKLPPCVAVTAIGECVNYRFDRTNNRKELSRFFRRLYRALAPGGVFVFDVAEPGRGGSGGPLKSFQGRDWALLLQVKEDRKRRVLTRRMTVFRKIGKLYRRSEEVHRVRLYPRFQIIRQLESAGFKVRVLSSYGRQSFSTGHIAFVAHKT